MANQRSWFTCDTSQLNSEIEATFNLEIVSENPIIAESEAEASNEEDSQDDS